MVAHRCRYIDIGIGMVQGVKAPEQRHRMLTAMHEIMHQVEKQKTQQEANPDIGNRPRWKMHIENGLDLRSGSLRRLEQKRDEEQVDDPKADVRQPPPQGGKFPPSPRPAIFPSCDNKQTAGDYDRDQRYLLTVAGLRYCLGRTHL
jgi:hypothetical protein